MWQGMVMHACNLSIWEAEAKESQVQDQPGLQSETLSQNTKKYKNKRETKKNLKKEKYLCHRDSY
jgi:hypothetical protein